MSELSAVLERMRQTLLQKGQSQNSSPIQQHGSTTAGTTTNTQLAPRNHSRSLQVKPQTALPPSTVREIEMAQVGQWNLEQFAVMVSKSEALKQQLLEELERLDSLMTPATPHEVKACLAKLILHFPMTNMTQHEKTLLLEDYIAELGRFPADMIAAACREYCLDEKSDFFPKAARLISACAGKYSILARRRKTIVAALEEGKRIKQRRLSDKELEAMMAGIREVEIPKPTKDEKIAATVDAMRKAGAPEADIKEFIDGAKA